MGPSWNERHQLIVARENYNTFYFPQEPYNITAERGQPWVNCLTHQNEP